MARYIFNIPEMTTEAFKECVTLCQNTIEAIGCSISGWDGTGKPVFSDKEICFNGTIPLSGDTFSIRRDGNVRSVIDTGHQPYDLAVRCCLVIFKRACEGMHLGMLVNDEELKWEQAEALVDAFVS